MINKDESNRNNQVIAIIQARMTSSRLPGKVLKPILGKSMLALQIERTKCSQLIDNLIVATSIEDSDQPIEDWCIKNNIKCYRGSLNNVLDRYFQVAKISGADHIVRMTADCPLIDSVIIDNVIKLHLLEKNDYTSNCIEPTFPDGLDVEVMTEKTLQKSWELASKHSEREHVTLYIRNHPEMFKIGSFKNDVNLQNKRWTVDYIEDFNLISNIYNALYHAKPNFNMQDILSLLKENPKWEGLNQDIVRNEGLAKSILEDKSIDE